MSAVVKPTAACAVSRPRIIVQPRLRIISFRCVALLEAIQGTTGLSVEIRIQRGGRRFGLWEGSAVHATAVRLSVTGG